MGIIGSLKKLFASKRSEALQSDVKRTEELVLEKGSLELGVAAGYTSHFIKEIESSLKRIEMQLPTRDWFVLHMSETIGKKLDSISEALNLLLKHFGAEGQLAPKTEAGIPLRAQQLTGRMKELIEAVKGVQSISYEDLAKTLSIGVSALRGLLSQTIRRTDAIERFEKGNRGWVRYKAVQDEPQALQSDLNRGESLLREKFERSVTQNGYTILQRYYQESPDFILSRNGDKIAVELKADSKASKLEQAIGQLMHAKAEFAPKELWLIVPSKISGDWLKIFEANQIKVFELSDQGLNEQISELKNSLSSQVKLFYPENSQ